jgi:hypothetical protein
MPQLTPLTPAQLRTLARNIGRAAVFYHGAAGAEEFPAPLRWNVGDTFNPVALGDTEGEVQVQANETIRTLTLPEIGGDAVFEARMRGGNPVLTAPLFLADPDLRRLIGPVATGVIGRVGEVPVTEWSLWVLPRGLFTRADGSTGVLRYDDVGSVWQVGDGAASWDALTATQTRLLGQSIFIPAGFWTRPPVTYRDGTNTEISKDIEECEFQSLVHPDMDGLAFQGDPVTHDIDLTPAGPA